MNGRIVREDKAERIALPILGSIKIGKKNEKGYPMSVDYFIATGKYESLFRKTFGEKPNLIQIIFPDDDAAKVCNEHYEYRNDAGQLVASGDGEIFRVWDEQAKTYREFSKSDYPDIMERVVKRNPTKKGDWEITLTMLFIIPRIKGLAGVWKFTTKGSASTIPNITGIFDAMNQMNGHSKGVIFDMSVEFAKSQKPNDRSRYPVVNIIPNESEENISMVKAAINNDRLLGYQE